MLILMSLTVVHHFLCATSGQVTLPELKNPSWELVTSQNFSVTTETLIFFTSSYNSCFQFQNLPVICFDVCGISCVSSPSQPEDTLKLLEHSGQWSSYEALAIQLTVYCQEHNVLQNDRIVTHLEQVHLVQIDSLRP